MLCVLQGLSVRQIMTGSIGSNSKVVGSKSYMQFKF